MCAPHNHSLHQGLTAQGQPGTAAVDRIGRGSSSKISSGPGRLMARGWSCASGTVGYQLVISNDHEPFGLPTLRCSVSSSRRC
jgi:hypothetical protein